MATELDYIKCSFIDFSEEKYQKVIVKEGIGNIMPL